MRNDLLIIGLVSICLFPYLVQASELPYKQMEDPDLQVVSLQYSDPRFTMLVVLPGPGMELQAAQDWLDLQDISGKAVPKPSPVLIRDLNHSLHTNQPTLPAQTLLLGTNPPCTTPEAS